MNDPFVSYDTFSVGAEFDAQQDAAAPAPPKELPLLARLQRLSTPEKKTKKRFDDAESIVTGAHVAEAGRGFDLEPPPGAMPGRSLVGNPAATIRIDTVSPTDYQDLASEPAASTAASPVVLPFKPATAESPVVDAPAADDETLSDPWIAWLLNLESAVLPYSRIIVLAAVIAALGLTLVLLQGGAAKTDTTGGAPQVQIETAESVLAATTDEAPPWSGGSVGNQPNSNDGLRPLETPPSTALASGPASAARGPGRATLVGEVRPVAQARVNVADATGQPNFSRTK